MLLLPFVNHVLLPHRILDILGDDSVVFPMLYLFWDKGFVYAIASGACEFLYLFFVFFYFFFYFLFYFPFFYIFFLFFFFFFFFLF